MALPLGFSGKLRILPTKFMPGELHAIEGSRVSFCLLQVLRTALVAASWSKKMPLAHVGAVFSLLDGPPGCDPGFDVICIGVGFCEGTLPTTLWRFQGYMACLVGLRVGVLVTVLFTFWLEVRVFSVSLGIHRTLVGLGLGLPMLHHPPGPYQHFKTAIWNAWRSKVCFGLCRRQGFSRGPMLDIAGSLQLLHAPHVRERNKALLRSILVGGEWFFLVMPTEKSFHAVFVAVLMEMGTFFGNVLTLLVHIRENPEFHDLIQKG